MPKIENALKLIRIYGPDGKLKKEIDQGILDSVPNRQHKDGEYAVIKRHHFIQRMTDHIQNNHGGRQGGPHPAV